VQAGDKSSKLVPKKFLETGVFFSKIQFQTKILQIVCAYNNKILYFVGSYHFILRISILVTPDVIISKQWVGQRGVVKGGA